MSGGSDHYKSFHFLKDCNDENFQMHIHVNYFNRLTFFAEISTKFQKITYLDNIRTITQEANMETRQITPFFSATFPTLSVCNIHFCI